MASTAEPLQRVIIQAPDKGLRQRLHDIAAKDGGQVRVELPIVDGFAASVTHTHLEQMRITAAAMRSPYQVTPDRVIELVEPPNEPVARPQLDVAAQVMELQPIWKQGFQGQNIGIAVIDTGMAPHPDYAPRIVAFQDFINQQTSPYDDRGHGTHVAGIAAGDGTRSHGKYKGAAPQANLIGVKVMNAEGKGELSTIIQGIQWAVDNRKNYNIKVINMSLGAVPTTSVKKDPLAQATTAATDAGVLVVAAAGNRGPYPSTIDTPANNPAVLAVGATVDYRTVTLDDDKVAYFSGTGPSSFDNYTKPDVVAPGSNIICADKEQNWYVTDSGTSMATPLVAGTAALMFQIRPDIKPRDLITVFRNTAQKIRTYEENIQGKGVPRPAQVMQILAQGGPSPSEQPTPAPPATTTQPTAT
jgi:serine protease AprX